MKFPKEFDLKVLPKKVNWEVMKGWVAKRVTELLGVEDEVLIAYIFEQLEGHDVSNFAPWRGAHSSVLYGCVPNKMVSAPYTLQEIAQSRSSKNPV